MPQPLSISTAANPEKSISPSPERPKRWAELLARVFGIDMSTCPDCGGPFKILAAILDRGSDRQLLAGPRTDPGVRWIGKIKPIS